METKELIRGLNPPQKEAVLRSYKRPTIVLAGAGSGKTSVLTKRIAYILNKGVSPQNVLAVTFTNKAAKEMKERISHIVGAKKASRLAIGTFHSLAVRWLHQYHSEAGLKKNWTIFDTDDTNSIIKDILTNLGLDNSKSSVFTYKAIISNAKNDMVGPTQYARNAQPDQRTNAKVYAAYQDALGRQNAVDFDDLIMKTVIMLERDPAIRAKFQNKYKYIMCDEFQDTNECQYRMIKAIVGDIDITRNNLFVVGDDFQGIYGWRGANINNILEFTTSYPTAKVIKLEQNYRSTQTVVDLGNAIIKNNTKQASKVCFSASEVGEKAKLFTANTDEEEARFIAEEIDNLVTFNGYNYGDFAILYRTNVQSRLLEDQFIRRKVPYNMVSGFSFYERKEIKDILAWLQLSVNPDNDMACRRILTMTDGVGKTSVQNIINAQGADSMFSTLYRMKLKTTKANAAIQMLITTISELAELYEVGHEVTDTPITEMLDLIFYHTGYIDKLAQEGTEEASRRIDNIRELQKIARGYEEDTKDVNLQDFLDQIALQSRADDLTDDMVQMMTMHTSKGLEFPVVFVIGMEEGLFPHQNSMGTPAQIEEERRLFYVGVTRAKKELYLTGAANRMDWSRNYNSQRPSRFLEELPDELIERLS